MTEQNILDNYCSLPKKMRFDFLCKYYAGIGQAIENCYKGLATYVNAQEKLERNKENGELGIRIQSSILACGPTATDAVQAITTEEKIKNGICDFESIRDIEEEALITKMIYNIRQLSYEYELLNMQMCLLKEKDKKFIIMFFTHENDRRYLAEKLCVSEGAIEKRVYRIKKDLRSYIYPFMINTPRKFN